MTFVSMGDVRMASKTLRAAKARSLLTIFGIAVGIVAVVTSVGIGDGIKAQVAGQIDHFGKDLITVRPGIVAVHPSGKSLIGTDSLFGASSIGGLTVPDLTAVQHAQGIGPVAPLGLIPGDVTSDENQTVSNASIIGTNADLPQVLNQAVPYGSFFGEGDEGSDVAVLGAGAAQQLFQESVPLGHKFTFRGTTFIVRGILGSLPDVPLSPASTFNNAVFIPDQTAAHLSNNTMQFYSILAKPSRPGQTSGVIHSIDSKLLATEQGQRNFSVLNAQQTLDANSGVLDLLTRLVSAVAAVSLLVGGVGVMNVMLVSVTERMHEIGVRKAIGATNRQILRQFLSEALVLSLIGGVVGVAAAVLIEFLLRTYSDLRPVISWQAVGVAAAVSILIGVIFGTAPAIKAARKDPINALRHE